MLAVVASQKNQSQQGAAAIIAAANVWGQANDGQYLDSGRWYLNKVYLNTVSDQAGFESAVNYIASSTYSNGEYKSTGRWYYNGNYVVDETGYNNAVADVWGLWNNGFEPTTGRIYHSGELNNDDYAVNGQLLSNYISYQEITDWGASNNGEFVYYTDYPYYKNAYSNRYFYNGTEYYNYSDYVMQLFYAWNGSGGSFRGKWYDLNKNEVSAQLSNAEQWGLVNNGKAPYTDRWYFNGIYVGDQNGYNNAVLVYNANYWGSTHDGQFESSGRYYYRGSYVGDLSGYNIARANYWGSTHDGQFETSGRYYYRGSYVGNLSNYNIARANYWGLTNNGQFESSGRYYFRGNYISTLAAYDIIRANYWGLTNNGQFESSGRYYFRGNYISTLAAYDITRADYWGLTNNGQFESSGRYYWNASYVGNLSAYNSAIDASALSALTYGQYLTTGRWYRYGSFVGTSLTDYDNSLPSYNAQADAWGLLNEGQYQNSGRWYWDTELMPNSTQYYSKYNNANYFRSLSSYISAANTWGSTHDGRYRLSSRWYYRTIYYSSLADYDVARAEYWGLTNDGQFESSGRYYLNSVYVGNLTAYTAASTANAWGLTHDGQYLSTDRWYYRGSYIRLNLFSNLSEIQYLIGRFGSSASMSNNMLYGFAKAYYWGRKNNGQYIDDESNITGRWLALKNDTDTTASNHDLGANSGAHYLFGDLVRYDLAYSYQQQATFLDHFYDDEGNIIGDFIYNQTAYGTALDLYSPPYDGGATIFNNYTNNINAPNSRIAINNFDTFLNLIKQSIYTGAFAFVYNTTPDYYGNFNSTVKYAYFYNGDFISYREKDFIEVNSSVSVANTWKLTNNGQYPNSNMWFFKGVYVGSSLLQYNKAREADFQASKAVGQFENTGRYYNNGDYVYM